jgi:putative tricarboxylic transport membrane protein
MKRWMNRISNIFLLGFAVLIFSLSLKLGFGTFRNPGPGFVPFLTSVLLLSLSLIVFIKEMRGATEEGEKVAFITWGNLTKPVYLTLALIGYALLFLMLGYLVSTFLLMLAMSIICEPKKWGVKIVTAAIIAGLSFLLFAVWLRVPLPKGIF